MAKEDWVMTRDVLKMTGLSPSTINTYLDSIWLGKYRKANRFYVCQDSLNILYSFLLKRGMKNDKVWQAAKKLKKLYPDVEEIILEFP